MQGPLPKPRRFQFTPSQVLVLGFALLILAGAIVLSLPIAHENGESFGFLNALFTATSAVCVTGLVVVDTATQFSVIGELVILFLIQAGGLGIMTLSALMLLMLGRRVGLQERLLMQEALGSFSIAGVVRLTKNIIATSLAIEAVGAVLLTARFWSQYEPLQAFYWGIFHSVSAFNNAGFDVTTQNAKIWARDPFVLFVLSSLIILGGIGFVVMQDVWTNRRWEKFSLHTRLVLRVTAGLLVFGTILLAVTEWSNPETFGALPWYHKWTNAWFTSVTARTAGFESIMTPNMLDVSLLIMIVLMFIGASPGGTGGGIKTTTFSMIMMLVRAVSTGREEIVLMGRRIARDLVDKAVVITTIALALVTVVWAVMMVTEVRALEDPTNPATAIKVLFEVVSAFGTVGLTAGMTSLLSNAGKILILSLMFVGRLGPLTLAVALAQRKHNRSPIHYPEDRVMIG